MAFLAYVLMPYKHFFLFIDVSISFFFPFLKIAYILWICVVDFNNNNIIGLNNHPLDMRMYKNIINV